MLTHLARLLRVGPNAAQPARRDRRVRPAVETLEDRTVPSVNLVESEPNNTTATANVVPRLPGEQVIMSGRIETTGDRDWYVLQLRAGDVIGATLNGRNGLNPALRLVNAAGELMMGNDDARGTGVALPKESPLPRHNPDAIDSVVYYVVPAAGMYYLEASASGDASTGGYNLELMIARPGLERQPVGTHQILFLDFDGAAVNFTPFGAEVSGTKQLRPLSSFLPSWGLSAADENAVIDGVVAKVRQKLATYVRANGLNGDYAATGVPGQFDLEIRNSRDNPDEFGKNPFVSRVVVGGTAAETGFPPNRLGNSQYIDVGNFKTDDEAVAFLGVFEPALAVIEIAPPATKLDFITEGISIIVSHEAGHIFGCFHTDQDFNAPFDGTPSLMDPNLNTFVGPDLVFGSADDKDMHFIAEPYYHNEVFSGLDDTLNTVSFGLSTGKGTGSAFAMVSAAGQPAGTGWGVAATGGASGGATWLAPGDSGLTPRAEPPAVSRSERPVVSSLGAAGNNGGPTSAEGPTLGGSGVGGPATAFAPPDPFDDQLGLKRDGDDRGVGH